MATQESEIVFNFVSPSNEEWDNRAGTEFFSGYKNSWEGITPEAQDRKNHLMEIFVRHNFFKPGAVIVDMACGKGALLPFNQEIRGDSGRIIELDSSGSMLSFSLDRAAALNMSFKNVSFVQASATETGLPENFCDTVILFNASPHFPDKTALLKECARILKSNGELIIAHSMSRDRLNEKRMGKVGADANYDALPTEDEINEFLSDAGFARTEYIDADYYLVKAQLVPSL